jgi:TatD DNase family protein
MLVDTHCHLDAPEFAADLEAVIARSQAARVGMIVMPAVHRETFDGLRDLASRHAGLCYALGIHPLCVDASSDDDLAVLRQAVAASINDPRFVAIGEIGLDHFVPGLDRERQARFLAAQLRIAREFDLPVLLHVRKAQDVVLKHLRQAAVRKGIAHAFNGSMQQAQGYIAQGFCLGFGGAMTWPRALQIRRLASCVADEAYVLETDAPDIPPVWKAGVRNEPGELNGIARCMGELREQSLDSVLRQSEANARRVLPRLAPIVDARKA